MPNITLIRMKVVLKIKQIAAFLATIIMFLPLFQENISLSILYMYTIYKVIVHLVP